MKARSRRFWAVVGLTLSLGLVSCSQVATPAQTPPTEMAPTEMPSTEMAPTEMPATEAVAPTQDVSPTDLWSATAVPPVPEGCWLAAAQKETCGKLISISGDSGDGRVQELPAILELSASHFSQVGDYVVLMMQLQPCNITTTSVAVAGSTWTPDLSERSGSFNICDEDAQAEDVAWIADMFDKPFYVKIVSDDQVRVSGEAAFVDLKWE